MTVWASACPCSMPARMAGSAIFSLKDLVPAIPIDWKLYASASSRKGCAACPQHEVENAHESNSGFVPPVRPLGRNGAGFDWLDPQTVLQSGSRRKPLGGMQQYAQQNPADQGSHAEQRGYQGNLTLPVGRRDKETTALGAVDTRTDVAGVAIDGGIKAERPRQCLSRSRCWRQDIRKSANRC